MRLKVSVSEINLFFLSGLLILFILGGGILPIDEDMLKNNIKFLTSFGVILYLLMRFKNYSIVFLFFYFSVASIVFSFAMLSTFELNYALIKYDSAVLCVVLSSLFISSLVSLYGYERFIRSIILFFLFILILTVFYKIKFGFWDRDVRFFINGANVFGWMMGFSTLLCLMYKRSKFILGLALLFFLAVLWSGSKGSLLATLFCSSIVFLFNTKSIYKFIFINFIFIFIFIFDYILSIITNFFPNSRFLALLRILNGEISESDHGSIGTRQEMFEEAWQLFIDNPFSGIGLGNYSIYSEFGFSYPHNAHLEVFMECGVFVGVIYLIYIILGFIFSNLYLRVIIIFFVIVSSFSGDISYLKFLLIMVALSYMLRFSKK